MPLDEILQRIKELPADKEIVAYCRGPFCMMSAEAVASFAGTRIAHRFSQDALKRGFAVFLLFVASYILLKSVIGG